MIAAVPPRADARDALCGAPALDALPPGARVGTSSLRRAAQLRALRPDLEVVDAARQRRHAPAQARRGDYDAIVLAAAGLQRLGRADAGAPRRGARARRRPGLPGGDDARRRGAALGYFWGRCPASTMTDAERGVRRRQDRPRGGLIGSRTVICFACSSLNAAVLARRRPPSPHPRCLQRAVRPAPRR